jgi:leader peptidase (prepilin peptidase)/N-methyltransferase
MYAFAAVGGLLVGSFLNVLALRMPRGESIVKPRSRCGSCGHDVRPYDNVPVFSWLLLRGRCRDCGSSISARYPAVEAITGVLWLLVLLAHGASTEAALGVVLVTLLVPMTLIDIEHKIIPNRLLLPFAIAAPVILALGDPDALAEHAISAAAAGGFFFLAVMAYPRGMGMGDVKLAAVLGLFLGRSVAPAVAIALVAGTVIGAVIIARKGAKEGRKTKVPFGPFLALGALVAIFAGDAMVDAYLTTFK